MSFDAGYSPEDDRRLAGSLVRSAGRLAARMLTGGLETEHKSSVSDVVSAADRAAEELIAGRLAELRPGDGLIGEEGTARIGSTGRTWFIDPVDGTYNFLSGLPFWCSTVALAEPAPGGGWRPILGAVFHPSADELWTGGPDIPTTCNEIPVPALRDIGLAESSLASYLHPPKLAEADVREPALRLLSGPATVRMLGSGSIELAYVAGGRIGAWAQRDAPDWDWLPGAALVAGAGGGTAVVEHRNSRWHLAGNRLAVAELRDRLLG